MRVRARGWLWKLTAPLFVIAFVLSMPLWLRVVAVSNFVHKYRLRQAAKSFACLKCGATLGVDALKRADRVWAEHMSNLMAGHPGARLRISRTLHAICVGCGTQYTFRESARTFVAEVLPIAPADCPRAYDVIRSM
jgi:hypothetical protein